MVRTWGHQATIPALAPPQVAVSLLQDPPGIELLLTDRGAAGTYSKDDLASYADTK